MQRYIDFSKRNVDGILLLDKPSGLSSRFASYKIKQLFCAKKVGHVGTLDPIATGMLPICLGRATKFAKYLLNTDKRYQVVVKLGESTDTFDAYGALIRVLPIKFNSKKLDQCLNVFKGVSYQVPPMFSSLKYNGIPLYKYARKGINIPRKSRIIYVYDLSYLRKQFSIIELDIRCSKGTYIRSIVNDLGECLGCGAHVSGLRRLMVGEYLSSSMISIKTLESVFYNNDLNDSEVLKKFDSLLISLESLNSLIH